MSYAYQIKLESATAQVTETGIWRPKIMEILSQAEMERLTREELCTGGWDRDHQGVLHKEIDGVRCEVPADLLEVRAVVSDQVRVRQTITADSDDIEEVLERRRQAGEKQRDRALIEAQRERQRILVTQLVSLEPLVNQELDHALHRAHARALEIKASRMGDIQSVSRSESETGELEMTIHVKVR